MPLPSRTGHIQFILPPETLHHSSLLPSSATIRSAPIGKPDGTRVEDADAKESPRLASESLIQLEIRIVEQHAKLERAIVESFGEVASICSNLVEQCGALAEQIETLEKRLHRGQIGTLEKRADEPVMVCDEALCESGPHGAAIVVSRGSSCKKKMETEGTQECTTHSGNGWHVATMDGPVEFADSVSSSMVIDADHLPPPQYFQSLKVIVQGEFSKQEALFRSLCDTSEQNCKMHHESIIKQLDHKLHAGLLSTAAPTHHSDVPRSCSADRAGRHAQCSEATEPHTSSSSPRSPNAVDLKPHDTFELEHDMNTTHSINTKMGSAPKIRVSTASGASSNWMSSLTALTASSWFKPRATKQSTPHMSGESVFTSKRSDVSTTKKRNGLNYGSIHSKGLFGIMDREHSFGEFLDDITVEQDAGTKSLRYKEGHWATSIVLNRYFKKLSLLVVFLNAVTLGIEVDSVGAVSLYTSDTTFIIASNLFCLYFALEWALRFCAYQNKSTAIANPDHFVETLLLCLSVSFTWVIEPFLFLLVDQHGRSLSVKPFRIFQICWLLRIVRFVRTVPELKILTRGIIMGTQAVFWTLLLVLMLTFMFGVILHELLGAESDLNERMAQEGGRNFLSLRSTMWTLLIDAAIIQEFGEKMTILVYEGKLHTIFACCLMAGFMFINALTILNMLIGVMNGVVTRMTELEKTETAVTLCKHTILKQLAKFDDGDGLISRAELEQVMNDEESEFVLRQMDVDRLFFLELQGMLFTHSEAAVPVSRIVELMLLCRGSSVTTVRTMASGLLYLASLIHDLQDMLEPEEPPTVFQSPKNRRSKITPLRGLSDSRLRDTKFDTKFS